MDKVGRKMDKVGRVRNTAKLQYVLPKYSNVGKK
jgi:hypothetical protein